MIEFLTHLLGYTDNKIGKGKKLSYVFDFFVYFEIRNMEVSHASLTFKELQYIFKLTGFMPLCSFYFACKRKRSNNIVAKH